VFSGHSENRFQEPSPSLQQQQRSQGYDPVLPVVGKYLFSDELRTHNYAVAALNTSWVFAIPN
jgi:hypothetical protein